jgi:hypothetical protein
MRIEIFAPATFEDELVAERPLFRRKEGLAARASSSVIDPVEDGGVEAYGDRKIVGHHPKATRRRS